MATTLISLSVPAATASVAVDVNAADWAGGYTDAWCSIKTSTPVANGTYLQTWQCLFTAYAAGSADTTSSFCREDASVSSPPDSAKESTYGCIASLDAANPTAHYFLTAQALYTESGDTGSRRCLGGSGTGSLGYTPPPGRGYTKYVNVSLTMDASGVVTVSGPVLSPDGIPVGSVQGTVITDFCTQNVEVSPRWRGTIAAY